MVPKTTGTAPGKPLSRCTGNCAFHNTSASNHVSEQNPTASHPSRPISGNRRNNKNGGSEQLPAGKQKQPLSARVKDNSLKQARPRCFIAAKGVQSRVAAHCPALTFLVRESSPLWKEFDLPVCNPNSNIAQTALVAMTRAHGSAHGCFGAALARSVHLAPRCRSNLSTLKAGFNPTS
jgi:hypothetical protein